MTIASPDTHKTHDTHDTFVVASAPRRIRVSGRTISDQTAETPRKSRTPDADYLAHDTRNWLTVLQVYCDLLRTSGAVASGYEKWIEELSSAVERGHGLVASLLNSVQEAHETQETRETQKTRETLDRQNPTLDSIHPARTPDRRWPGPPVIASIAASMAEPLDIADAVTRRLPLLQRLAGGNIQVEIDVQANAGKVALAESAFERILHNLVGNAIEAMPHGGHLRIALQRRNRRAEDARQVAKPENGPFKTLKSEAKSEAMRPGAALRPVLTHGDRRSGRTSNTPSQKIILKTLLLRVHDTGDGIPPEHLPYIFEAGVSGKTAREDDCQARGFGLSIVRELARLAGGAVRVRSRPGRGSCFEIELPRI